MKVKITLFSLLLLTALGGHLHAQCDGATFEEQNGIVVIEAETVSLTGSWRRQSSFSGFTGTGYINWTGSQFFNDPGNGVIQYRVRINSPGTYRFNWRSRVGIGSDNKEHNDSWLRIPDADDFYAQRGNSRIYPRGSGRTPNPEGASAEGWFKIYMNNLDWTWRAVTSDFDGHDVYARFDSAGVYTIQVSARSTGHLIDRMILYKESQYSAGSAENLSRGETRCDGSTPPPPPPPPSGNNTPPSVSITSPTAGQNFTAGSNVSVQLSASDSDGSIAKHEIFVNNTLVDTDGATYTPHVIQNIASGSYAIRARVTDNNGATAETTVNITAGGTTNPPPPPPTGGNTPPVVNITSPTAGQNFTAGSNVSVQLAASDSDGSIAKHEIFVNNTLVDTDGASYTPHVIQNIANGSYAIRARVTDNGGATAETTVNITVGGTTNPPPPPPTGGNNPPVVNITSPTAGQNFTAGSNVTVQLSASDPDGSVVKHEIFVNNTLVDTDPANFTPHVIRNITNGSYAIRARVTDNGGATAETTVNITVGGTTNPPPPSGNIPPVVNITNPAPGQVFTPGSNVSVQLSASDPDGSVVKHEIFVNNTLVDTDPANFTPHVIQNIASGNYAIRARVTDNGGATAETTVNITVGTTLSAREIPEAKASAYPNPVQDSKITVSLPEAIENQAGYQLMSPTGVLLERGVLNISGAQREISFDLDRLPQAQQGIYYLLITDGVRQYSIPIAKQ